jgi:hypothetical protein
MATYAAELSDSIDTLMGRIASLVLERQALRRSAAQAAVLERNRCEIARLQHDLSVAFAQRHSGPAA